MFLFSFSVQFSVNILKKLNIQSSSIMQLVKTAAETLQCIPIIEMKRCKKTNLVKEMLSEVSNSVFMRCQKCFRDKCTVIFTECKAERIEDRWRPYQRPSTCSFEHHVSMNDLLIERPQVPIQRFTN